MVVIGIYMYLVSNNGTNVVISRFLAADLTGETVCTVPTLAAASGALAWSDGASMYVVSANSSSTVNKWSISGTTFSAVTTASTSMYFSTHSSILFDGTNLYSFDDNWWIKKYSDVLGTTVSSTTQKGQWNIGLQAGAFISNIDTNRIYIGRMIGYNDATAQIANHVLLYPISKP